MWQIIRVMHDAQGRETDRCVLVANLNVADAGNILFEFSRLAEPLKNLLQDHIKLTGKRPGYIHDNDIFIDYRREKMSEETD